MRKSWWIGMALALCLRATGAPAADVPAPGDLRSAGTVSFPVSCKESQQADFNRGVALLHSFFYEESRRIFSSIAEQDPGCAMAQWGIAQTWWHPIWSPPRPDEFEAGRSAAEHALALESTPRERGFIEAIAAYYALPKTPMPPGTPVGQSCHGPVGTPERVIAYERAMRKLYDQFPADFEVQVFYAFAVLSVGYAMPTDTSLTNQRKAGEMLEALWKQNPHHPGVAHYIIHSYDYPVLAQRGLPAAQAYAAIAPWVPHALHMPSHIFTRLGMWDDSIATNLSSAEASRAYAGERGRTATESEELHALDYLMYSYLQEGRDTDARAVLDRVNGVHEVFPAMEFAAAYSLAAVPARYALEREAWTEAASLPLPKREQWERYPFVEALFEYTHALGRVHTGDLDGARKAIERMQALRNATTDIKFDYFRQHLDLQAQAANAWLAHAQGHDNDAVAALRAAADGEDALGKHPVSPGTLMPAREQLGELLLQLKRPHEALTAYEAELKIYPARFRSLYGAGLAAEQAGDRSLANRYFGMLLQTAAKADASRRELLHAREFVGT
jgi:tetratricopeptide (TPR) repeat protein